MKVEPLLVKDITRVVKLAYEFKKSELAFVPTSEIQLVDEDSFTTFYLTVLLESLTGNDKICLVLKDNDIIKGYLFASIKSNPLYRPNFYVHIHDLYVVPDYRSFNALKLIMDNFVKILEGNGVQLVRMESYIKNEVSNLLEHWGAEKVSYNWRYIVPEKKIVTASNEIIERKEI